MRNWNYYIKKTTAIMIASGMVVMTGCADKGQGAAADASGQAETVVQVNSQGQDKQAESGCFFCTGSDRDRSPDRVRENRKSC